ncbi:MAG TPA: FG-GAP-like repeat-containing protein, partial [bacterium]
WRDGRFRPEPGMFMPLESLFPKAEGEPQSGLNWVEDLNGDGFSELIVPRLDGFTVITQDASGTLVKRATLRTRPRGELLRWYRRQRVAYDLPNISFVAMDGSPWKSIVAYNNGLLSIFRLGNQRGGDAQADTEVDLQPPVPFDPKAPWDPPLLLVLAADLNGDGKLDLVFSKATSGDNDLNAKTRILVHYGRDGQQGGVTFQKEPDQVFALEGFTLPILLDMTGDGTVDLVLVNVEFSFWTAVKALIARSVSADAAYYRMRDKDKYPQRPDAQGSFSVKFSLGRLSHQPISLFGDLNGDGLPDLLLSTGSDTLGVHWGHKDRFWNTAPDATITDSFPIAPSRVSVTDLDGDGRDDLLITYVRDDIRQMPDVNRSFTVLLSRYPKAARSAAAREQ